MEPLREFSESEPLGSESDESLLIYMALREEDPNLARKAWMEFYLRHSKFVFTTAQRLWTKTFGRDVVIDAVQQTFVKVYEKADKFEGAKLSDDSNEGRRQVRAWLCSIAHNALIDTIRSIPITVPFLCDSESGHQQEPHAQEGKWWEPDQASGSVSPRILLIEEGLSELSEREQDILRITAEWPVPGKQLRIPPKDLQRLATALETTPENIRQIRRRALSKLKDYVESRERPN